jgi:DNA polymerase sigma
MALTAIQLRDCQSGEIEGETVVRVSTSKDEAKKSDDDDANSRDAVVLGRAMLNFLKLYGFETDLSKDIISVHSGGEGDWGVLSDAAQFPAPLGSGLRVKDPLDGSNNAGAGCFGIAGVQAVFREQLETLKKAAENGFESKVPLLMQLFTLGGSQKVFVV